MLDTEARERVGRVEALLEAVDALPDPAARETATDMAAALLELYGEGLARLVGHVAEHDDGRLAAALAGDELVAHLLLLHGLHPVPLEERVRGALDEVRPYLESHGGGVELLGRRGRRRAAADGGELRRLPLVGRHAHARHRGRHPEGGARRAGDRGGERGAGAGRERTHPARGDPGGERGAGRRRPHPARGDRAAARGGAAGRRCAGLGGGGRAARTSAARRCATSRASPSSSRAWTASVYAYRPGCPACGASLGAAAASGAELTCASCGHAYDVVLAGRCRDAPELHLDPLPLLVDDAGLVRVALGSGAA